MCAMVDETRNEILAYRRCNVNRICQLWIAEFTTCVVVAVLWFCKKILSRKIASWSIDGQQATVRQLEGIINFSASKSRSSLSRSYLESPTWSTKIFTSNSWSNQTHLRWERERSIWVISPEVRRPSSSRAAVMCAGVDIMLTWMCQENACVIFCSSMAARTLVVARTNIRRPWTTSKNKYLSFIR